MLIHPIDFTHSAAGYKMILLNFFQMLRLLTGFTGIGAAYRKAAPRTWIDWRSYLALEPDPWFTVMYIHGWYR